MKLRENLGGYWKVYFSALQFIRDTSSFLIWVSIIQLSTVFLQQFPAHEVSIYSWWFKPDNVVEIKKIQEEDYANLTLKIIIYQNRLNIQCRKRIKNSLIQQVTRTRHLHKIHEYQATKPTNFIDRCKYKLGIIPVGQKEL